MESSPLVFMPGTKVVFDNSVLILKELRIWEDKAFYGQNNCFI
jgi:hypothetical protein